MKVRTTFTCPLELVMDMISGKWKTIILWRLRLGHQRFSNLCKDINGISEKMLLEHIAELIECSFVQKDSNNGYPLVVHYSLTELGRELIIGLEIFQKVGIHFLEQDKI